MTESSDRQTNKTESKIEVQCECGTFVPVKYNKQLGLFRGMCPNKECQIWQNMRVTQLETQQNHFESNTTEPKTCPNCGTVWVEYHNCKGGNKFAQAKAIMEAMS